MPVGLRAHACDAAKHAAEIGKLRIPHLRAHRADLDRRSAQQAARLVDARLGNVVRQRHPHLVLKQSREIGGVQIYLRGDVFPRQILPQMRVDVAAGRGDLRVVAVRAGVQVLHTGIEQPMYRLQQRRRAFAAQRQQFPHARVRRFRGNAAAMADAQRCIGRSPKQGNLLQRARNGLQIFSILVTWALENAVDTADSMKSRGYGLPGRTAYSNFVFDKRDAFALAAIVFFFFFLIIGAGTGNLYFRYFPSIKTVNIVNQAIMLLMDAMAI